MQASGKKMQYHKTKLCPWYDNGRCFMGQKCNYAHSVEELRLKPDLSCTKLCPETLKGMPCSRKHCRFAHDFGELQATKAFFKTKICKFWTRGMCPASVECRHAHGQEELRSVDPRLLPVTCAPSPHPHQNHTHSPSPPPSPCFDSTTSMYIDGPDSAGSETNTFQFSKNQPSFQPLRLTPATLCSTATTSCCSEESPRLNPHLADGAQTIPPESARSRVPSVCSSWGLLQESCLEASNDFFSTPDCLVSEEGLNATNTGKLTSVCATATCSSFSAGTSEQSAKLHSPVLGNRRHQYSSSDIVQQDSGPISSVQPCIDSSHPSAFVPSAASTSAPQQSYLWTSQEQNQQRAQQPPDNVSMSQTASGQLFNSVQQHNALQTTQAINEILSSLQALQHQQHLTAVAMLLKQQELLTLIGQTPVLGLNPISHSEQSKFQSNMEDAFSKLFPSTTPYTKSESNTLGDSLPFFSDRGAMRGSFSSQSTTTSTAVDSDSSRRQPQFTQEMAGIPRLNKLLSTSVDGRDELSKLLENPNCCLPDVNICAQEYMLNDNERILCPPIPRMPEVVSTSSHAVQMPFFASEAALSDVATNFSAVQETLGFDGLSYGHVWPVKQGMCSITGDMENQLLFNLPA